MKERQKPQPVSPPAAFTVDAPASHAGAPRRQDPYTEGRQMLRTLLKTGAITGFDDQSFAVRYFEVRTLRGARRFSAEIIIAPGDRVILDDDSVCNLEVRAACLVPATLYSRELAARATAA
jgi:hypothetical protein